MKYIYFLLLFCIFSACSNTSKNNQVHNTPDVAIISDIEDEVQTLKTPTLSHLNLYNPKNLDILYTEILLRSLEIKYGNSADLTPLMNLCFLEELHLESMGKFDDISPLSKLTNLKKLYLSTLSDDDFDLSPIAELTNLEELYLYANIKDIAPLRTLVNLRKLELPGTSTYESVLPFSELVNLQEFYISHDHANNTFAELLPLQWLEVLTIFAVNPVELDITNITRLRTLKKLYISSLRNNFQIKNINGLQNLTNIEVLEIEHYGMIDLSFVRHLKKMHTLWLRHCVINDISPLLDLPDFENLHLVSSMVRDFSPLLNSPSIKMISGVIFDDEFTWSPVYNKFEEQGVGFYSGVADSK
jgi:Leucine-rich repeat (LRR) protein